MEYETIMGEEYETIPPQDMDWAWFPDLVGHLAAECGWVVYTYPEDGSWYDAVFLRDEDALYVAFSYEDTETPHLGENRQWVADVMLQGGDIRFWTWSRWQDGSIHQALGAERIGERDE